MILPRLIIADEHRVGKVPSGVLIAHALKEQGYKLKIFIGGTDETSLRSLQLLCNLPVTMLDPILCDGKENLRWLFQQAASPDCLNLILTSLGGRWTEDSPFRIPKECILLAEWLDCELVPVVCSDTSSTITIRSVSEVMSQFDRSEIKRIHSVLFRAVLNNREFELLEREAGRQTSSISMGSIPKELERDVPLLTDLCTENYGRALLPLRSAGVQLKTSEEQITWGLFSALAHAAPEWQRQRMLAEPITEKANIAVVRHPALTLGGNGTELLFQALGCEIVDIPLEGNATHSVPIHGVYIPHGLTHIALPRFFSNLYLKTMISRAAEGQFFFFAEGGSSPLMGETITLPPGKGEGASGRGFGLMPFTSLYKSTSPGQPLKVVAFRKRKNTLITGSQEWVWGYMSPNLQINPIEPSEICWEVREGMNGKPLWSDAWCKGRALVTAMRPEFWSCPQAFRRWLEG